MAAAIVEKMEVVSKESSCKKCVEREDYTNFFRKDFSMTFFLLAKWIQTAEPQAAVGILSRIDYII